MSNCKACQDIREYAPEVADNGITTTACDNLQNNRGFNKNINPLHTDGEDLRDLNDCYFSNSRAEVIAYDFCTWREFMREKFLPRIYNMFKGLICAVSGLWCKLTHMANGYEIDLVEEKMPEDWLGIGVKQRGMPTFGIIGNSWRFEGGFRINAGDNPAHWGKLGLAENGSAISGHILNTTSGNWTLCIVPIEKKEYPQIKGLFSGVGSFVDASMGDVRVSFYDEGEEYYGPWGEESGKRKVPSGFIYARVSIVGVTTWGYETTDIKNITVSASGMARANLDNFKC